MQKRRTVTMIISALLVASGCSSNGERAFNDAAVARPCELMPKEEVVKFLNVPPGQETTWEPLDAGFGTPFATLTGLKMCRLGVIEIPGAPPVPTAVIGVLKTFPEPTFRKWSEEKKASPVSGLPGPAAWAGDDRPELAVLHGESLLLVSVRTPDAENRLERSKRLARAVLAQAGV